MLYFYRSPECHPVAQQSVANVTPDDQAPLISGVGGVVTCKFNITLDTALQTADNSPRAMLAEALWPDSARGFARASGRPRITPTIPMPAASVTPGVRVDGAILHALPAPFIRTCLIECFTPFPSHRRATTLTSQGWSWYARPPQPRPEHAGRTSDERRLKRECPKVSRRFAGSVGPASHAPQHLGA